MTENMGCVINTSVFVLRLRFCTDVFIGSDVMIENGKPGLFFVPQFLSGMRGRLMYAFELF